MFVGGAGGFARALRREGDEGVESFLQRLRALEGGLGQSFGAGATFGERGGKLTQRGGKEPFCAQSITLGTR